MNARRTIAAGLIASIAMGMVEMVYEALAGDGFWSPVIYIGATVLRGLQRLVPPVGFQFWPVVLGFAGHMMNSVILSWLFAAFLLRRLASRQSLVISGAIYGLVVFFAMWYMIVPVVDPVMLNLNASVFALAHLVWGAALGTFLPARSEATPRASAA